MTALIQPAQYYTTVSPVEALEEQKTPSVPPSYGAPGRVLLATGQRTTPAFRALQIAGHDVTECYSLRRLCFQLKYSRPDLVCLHENAVGPIDQAMRIIRGRHNQVPIVLFSEDPAPGLTPIRQGYYASMSEPIDGEQLMVTAAHAIAHCRMVRRIRQLETETAGEGFAGIVGVSDFAKRAFRKLQSFASADVHVLLMGELGTGKSLAARAVHDHSARARGPFIALNAERLSDSAFSASALVNASIGSPPMREHGALDDADRGTLYIANIDALSPRLQTQLLAALGEDAPSDFRLIASTTKNLDELGRRGAFLPALASHLGHAQLFMQPFRNRPSDVGAIARTVLNQLAHQQGRPRMQLSLETIQALEQHSFVRNGVELREIIASALVNSAGSTIDLMALPAMVQVSSLVGARYTDVSGAPDSAAQRKQVLFEILAQRPMKMRDIERCAIEAALHRTRDNVTQAMRELGVGRTTLYRKLKKYGRR
jgi:two-component system, NtrC family, response regulator